jgi:hemin uptake protein HemP
VTIQQVKPPNRAGEARDRCAAPLRVTSERLLGPDRELVILHNGREYRLRRTRGDRLILTA